MTATKRQLAQRIRRLEGYQVVSARQLYVRFTHGSNPMSDYGHAMFVELDKLDSISSGYGRNLWVYDGKKAVGIDKIKNKVWKDWREDIENETMDYNIGSLENMSKSEFLDELNPDDIVDSADLWENREFISWFWNRYEHPAIVTYDGALVFERRLVRKPTKTELNLWGLDD